MDAKSKILNTSHSETSHDNKQHRSPSNQNLFSVSALKFIKKHYKLKQSTTLKPKEKQSPKDVDKDNAQLQELFKFSTKSSKQIRLDPALSN